MAERISMQETDSQRSRTKGKRFALLSKKSKRTDTPPPPVPHYAPINPAEGQDEPVSPLEEDDNKVRMSSDNIWPGQRSPSLAPHETAVSARSNLSPEPTFDEALDMQRDIQEQVDVVEASHAQRRTIDEPSYGRTNAIEEPSYDLRPPPPTTSHSNIEQLALRLFSLDHINAILKDPVSSARFNKFITAYRPKHTSALKQYAESRKAVLAIEYANAIAHHIYTGEEYRAAAPDRAFQAKMNQNVNGLVDDALPAYITHRLTQIVTDTLVKEITQNSAPIMRELIPNLAEVYCITDPSLQDNPIVYASQEFYNVSQYSRDYVIGRNCRFLQGPKTANTSIQRMIEALRTGQEVCETILNYRRDGSPFMNLLLLAPLYDNKGQVRYFLGCQIDVSPLIQGGRGLESFEQLLAQDRVETRFAGALGRDPKYTLAQLGAMLSEEETSVIKTRTATMSEVSRQTESRLKEPRRIIGADDVDAERPLWPHHSLGSSGRLPGVYQNYLLVRPYPSLRITFTSPALRIPGLVQAKLLDRIGGPNHVRESILDAFAHGTGLTAKIQWLTTSISPTGVPYQESRPRWIHCTPLLGSDEQVGVWMIVMVENEEVTGSLRRPMPQQGSQDGTLQFGPIHQSVRSNTTSNSRLYRSNLYADYLQDDRRRDDSAHAEGLVHEDAFRDFD